MVFSYSKANKTWESEWTGIEQKASLRSKTEQSDTSEQEKRLQLRALTTFTIAIDLEEGFLVKEIKTK